MAQAAETPHFSERSNEADGRPSTEAQSLPASPPPSRPVAVVTRVKLGSSDAARVPRNRALDALYGMAAKSFDACEPFIKGSVALTREVGTRVTQFKEERPLQLIGVISGSAFALGMAVRIW